MSSKRTTYRSLRRRLLARASSLAVRVALRPRGWAPGLLAAGLIGAQGPVLAQETIDLATEAELTIQGAATNDISGISVSGAGDVNGDGIDDLIIGAAGAASYAGASYVVFGGPAAAIERLIARVEAADLQPRIEAILTKTLTKGLDNVNKGKERRAIVALHLFIIEVKAFRGKKIPEAVADAWIADAEAIIDTLKAQKDRHRTPRHHAPSPMVEAQE
jgi:hypothetical protein